jgi:hypothetical protein
MRLVHYYRTVHAKWSITTGFNRTVEMPLVEIVDLVTKGFLHCEGQIRRKGSSVMKFNSSKTENQVRISVTKGQKVT